MPDLSYWPRVWRAHFHPEEFRVSSPWLLSICGIAFELICFVGSEMEYSMGVASYEFQEAYEMSFRRRGRECQCAAIQLWREGSISDALARDDTKVFSEAIDYAFLFEASKADIAAK